MNWTFLKLLILGIFLGESNIMDIETEIMAISSSPVVVELKNQVESMMNKSAMMYRIFARAKTPKSVAAKIKSKNYLENGKKMQDLFGLRIALYFADDVEICCKLIHETFEIDNVSKTDSKDKEFGPVILNYVCKLPKQIKEIVLPDFWNSFPIDDTFEVQIRTVFSEGWHEIEHDLRYKCIDDWKEEHDMNRALNGIYATLETCDWSIINLFDRIAYQSYKQGNWSAMFRNKWRLRIANDPINDKLLTVFNNDHSVAKEFFKIPRADIISVLIRKELANLPKNYNNLIYVANYVFVKNSTINELTPELIKSKCTTIIDSLSGMKL